MQLPEKNFHVQQCKLAESDFESNNQAKPLKLFQLLQDVATDHAEKIGLGWHVMDENGMLWILSKISLVWDAPVTRKQANFTLYTWPLAPERIYAERCFAAVSESGSQLFSATSMWTIISREERKILPAQTMNNFYHGEYSAVHSSAPANFARVRLDDGFSLCYEKTVRRSDLDKNHHVNNTTYVTYAVDVLNPDEEICQMDVTYHKELKFGDAVQVFVRRDGQNVQVVGTRSGEPCFSSYIKLAKEEK